MLDPPTTRLLTLVLGCSLLTAMPASAIADTSHESVSSRPAWGAFDPARVDSLASVVRRGELLWIERAGEPRISALVLTSGEERDVELPFGAEELSERIDLYLALLRDPGRAAEAQLREVVDESAGLRLGEALLGPCRDLLAANPRLIVLSDDVTCELPWATLYLRSDATPTASSRSVLQVAETISVETVGRFLAERRQRSDTGAIGYESPPRILMEDRCPAARFYHGIEIKPARLELQRALRRRQYDVLQLEATDQLQLELPYLDFALLGSRPRLALLCQPHAGDARDAVDLSRELQRAGAGTVVTNLWPVDQWVEARLLARFYEALADGQTAGTALMLAQRQLQQDDATRSPALWGSFALFGDDRVTVVLRRRLPRAWVRGGIGIAAGVSIVLLFGLRFMRDRS